jgi:glucosamine kinase
LILIADGGSTKTEWSVLSATGTRKIITQGISPYFLNTDQIRLLLEQELLVNLADAKNIQQVFYYGTGCTSPHTVSIVYNALTTLFPGAPIHIDYDLVAAAHALCGKSEGIACILGTGSNSCYYNGNKIELNSPGLGFILGDEGSGAHLGKKIIAAYLYGKLDNQLEEVFQNRFTVNKDSLLESIYTAALPNRYLASYSIFFSEHRGHPHLEKLLTEGLDDFFKVHISTYPQSILVPVHFTGSIAWGYRDVLVELCKKYNFTPGKIIKEPMNGLVGYYRNNYNHLLNQFE